MMSNPALDQISGDCLVILPTLPPASVDMVFADPPYNLQTTQGLRPNLTLVDAVDEDRDQFENFTAYDVHAGIWARPRCDEAHRHDLGVRHVSQHLPRRRDHAGPGFWLLNTVTWFKPNAMPTRAHGSRTMSNSSSGQARRRRALHLRPPPDEAVQRRQTVGQCVENPGMQRAERLRDANGDKLHPLKTRELLQRVILASSRPGDVISTRS